jgi:hypothetical protein
MKLFCALLAQLPEFTFQVCTSDLEENITFNIFLWSPPDYLCEPSI